MKRILFLAAGVLFMLASCTQKAAVDTVEAGMPDFVPTADDTTQVTTLVESFLDRLAGGDTAGAASMLRNRNSINPYSLEPDSLEADELKAVVDILGAIDISEAEIEKIDFGQFSDKTTVTCSAVTGSGYKTKLILKPVKAKFIWRLALPTD